MKAFKIGLIAIGSLLITAYLVFLLVLPNVISLKNYTYELNDEKKVNQGLIIKLEDLKISTTWKLSAGAKIGKVNAFYKNGNKFAQIDDINVTVSLPYLLIKKIKLDKVSVNKIITRLQVENDGKFTIEKFIPTTQENSISSEVFEIPYGLSFSDNMPDILLGKYSISFIDVDTDKTYSIKGSNFRISDFILNKKIKFKSSGKVYLDKNEQFNFDLSLTSHVMPDFTSTGKDSENANQFNIIKVFKDLRKLNLTANVNADIVLKGSQEDIKTYGSINVSNLSALVKGSQLPPSDMQLAMDGNKIKISSNLYTANNEKATVDGLFKYGKSQYVDLNVKSNRLELRNLFALINATLPVFGVTDLNGIQANGIVDANFNIKSDFKTINSSGFLKIANANIYYNIFNVALKNIQADIDFSRNQININKASAYFNGAPLSLTGAIDTNAYANLKILADKLPLKAVFVALGQLNLVNENVIKSGNVTLNGIVKGKLDTVEPQINVAIENVNLYNKPNKATLILKSAKLDALTQKNAKVNGKGNILGLKVLISGFPTFSVPNSKISFNEKDINLDSVYVNLNNSKISVLGKITDYTNSNIKINVTARGLLGANDIKSSLDKSIRNTVHATGKLPIIAKIFGNDKVQTINVQILANNTNHLSLVEISSLLGRTSLINLDLKIENNVLKINDISINALSHNNGITEDFNANLSKSSKILQIKGVISNLTAKVQNISSLNISIPNQVGVSIAGFKNSRVNIKGDINVSGKVNNPQITGMINIPSLSIPSLETTGKSITVNITKNLIDIYCGQLNVVDSAMSIVATMNNNFKNGIYIRNMDFNSSNLNADSMSKIIANLPQNAVAPGTDTGITIASGKAKVEKIISGNMLVTNVTSDFNLKNNVFRLKNIYATAYGGKVVGEITYNLLYASTGINLQGRGLNSTTALYGATGIKNLMEGLLDFDATNLTARGLTDKQIMQSLKGNVKFIVSNGQMGTLGKLENLLYAQNILANNILKTTMGAVVGAVKVKKTGEFKYIKGNVSLSNGWAYLEKIQTSGPAMSMYIKGKVNILNSRADLIILGRLSNEVVSVLGPIGNFSVNSLIASIPKIGTITSSLINQMTTNPSGENLALLPDLTPSQANTKEFKAAINGAVDSTSSVSYFKWLATPKAVTNTTTSPSQTTSNIQQSAQQAINSAKSQAQNAINKVINLPSTSNSTTVPQTPSTPSTGNSNNGVADFINSLPNLNLNK